MPRDGAAYRYRINEFSLNDGQKVTPGDICVFVGPNNSGKTRALRDLLNAQTKPLTPRVIVTEVQVRLPGSLTELQRAYDLRFHTTPTGESYLRDLGATLLDPVNYFFGRSIIQDQALYGHIQDRRIFAETFGPALVAYLSTDMRLLTMNENDGWREEGPPQNLLQKLYSCGSSLELTLRSEIRSAFGCDIALDFSGGYRYKMRVGNDFSSLPPDPRDAAPFLARHEKLDDQGDGIRSFTTIVAGILATGRDVIMVDEPEAFLHPPQAYRMGRLLARHANSGRQLFVGTHSADIIRGILSHGSVELKVVRIEREGNQNRFTMVDPEVLQMLSTDPLLSSARVLEGLFYSGAVVVEADADARFYASAIRKVHPEIDLHFVNADNKQTVEKIIRLYRQVGLRSAGIVDFDVLNDPGEFAAQIAEYTFTQSECDLLEALRNTVAVGVGEVPPEKRLSALRERLSLILDSMPTTSGPEARHSTPATKVYRRCVRSIHEALNDTRSWADVKKAGVKALAGREKAVRARTC